MLENFFSRSEMDGNGTDGCTLPFKNPVPMEPMKPIVPIWPMEPTVPMVSIVPIVPMEPI